MKIELVPVSDENKEAVLALSVREDQPFVAPNNVSLKQADEANAEDPGIARPFAICADGKPVGFCMFAFALREIARSSTLPAFATDLSLRHHHPCAWPGSRPLPPPYSQTPPGYAAGKAFPRA